MAELRLRSVRNLGHSERSIAKWHKAVAHRHFGSQRLERIEALIGILHRSLKLVKLLLESIAFAADRVIAVGLPEHSGIRPDAGNHRNPANDGQYRQHVENINGDPELEDAALVV